MPTTTTTSQSVNRPTNHPVDRPVNAADAEADARTHAQVSAALAALTLQEKVLLLTGRDFWTTWPLETIGLRSMVLSDGPSGVRGPVWDERSPSLNLPSATALASAWDTGIAGRYGAAAAVEARRKGVDVVLGPTINLHRSPYGGRHFEAFSEDPVLTADLAAAYVRGLQDNGVAATPKHYVANDAETDRFTVDNRIGERALREVYLLAFEKAVVDSRAWLVMSAYNAVNGTTMTENDLLETPLNSEWGFDGVVVSDWTAVRSLDAATASQDLVMPGPRGAWGDALVEAVRSGRVPESAVDRKVARLLRLAVRVGALGDAHAAPVRDIEDGVAFTREAAAEGMVLLTNRPASRPTSRVDDQADDQLELPWQAAALTSVAVIGNNAALARTQGGGSATVVPEHTVSPLDGLRQALPDARVTYAMGAVVQEGVAAIPLAQLSHPVSGAPGARAAFLDADDAEIFVEDRLGTELVWFGGAAPLEQAAAIELRFTWTPSETGPVNLGFACVGHGQVWVDGQLLVDEVATPVGTDLGAAVLSPPSRSGLVQVEAGQPREVRVRLAPAERDGALPEALNLTVGTEPASSDADALIAAAVEAAAQADVALVVVGTSAAVESEGFDRTSLALPGRQDDLVRAVAAANPHTVVVVNAGAPVLTPWREDVAAVLVGWFGGQQFGAALADVLLGVREPGGRLPTTWAAEEADLPVSQVVPTDGVLAYEEGIHIGYRAWLRSVQSGTAPAFWFGHGLGYSDVVLTDVSGPLDAQPGESVTVSVGVTNRGSRRSKQVVQVYASRPASAHERAERWLVGFAPVRVDAGASARVEVEVPTHLLAVWQSGWTDEPGRYELHVGTSAADTPLHTSLTLGGDA